MNRERGATLLTLARNAIAADLGVAQQPCAEASWLERPGASFVTLTQNGELRGCIGNLEANRALRADVQANARAAAFHDPRFPALTQQDYPSLQIEISVLSPTVSLDFDSEQDALKQLRPGIDGVILEYRRHHSTFLPQVWEQLKAPRAFLDALKLKAGLRADFWHPDIKLSRYTVEKWREEERNEHPPESA